MCADANSGQGWGSLSTPVSLHLGPSLRPGGSQEPSQGSGWHVLPSVSLLGTVRTCLRHSYCWKGPVGQKHAESLFRASLLVDPSDAWCGC